MGNIKKITEDGFSVEDVSLALMSLKLSLQAYFSTYNDMAGEWNLLSPERLEFPDSQYTYSYLENCTEAILHFHHFVEIVIKNILRKEHILLADFTSSYHHIILSKILRNEKISDKEKAKLQSISFKVALDRLNVLIGESINGTQKNTTYGQWGFIKKYKSELDEIGRLRNRLIHRGVFALQYKALDRLFGEFVLPFVKEVMSTDEYSGMEDFWRYSNLNCGVDPIDALIATFADGKDYNSRKVALLKEFARAGYKLPKQKFKAKSIKKKKGNAWQFSDFVSQQRAERVAELEFTNTSEMTRVSGVYECPVCGTHSLVVYTDIEFAGYEDEIDIFNSNLKMKEINSHVFCWYCTFSVKSDLKNPEDYGIPCAIYWKKESELSHFTDIAVD